MLNLKVRCDFFHAFFWTYLQGFELGLSDQRKNIAVVCHWLALGWLLYLQLNKRLLLPRVTLWCNWQTVLQIWTIIWTNEDHITSFMLLYITIYPFVTKLWKREMMYWRACIPHWWSSTPDFTWSLNLTLIFANF